MYYDSGVLEEDGVEVRRTCWFWGGEEGVGGRCYIIRDNCILKD